MLILNYASKKDLKAAIGQPLSYRETSLHGAEYRPTGRCTGSNRPSLTGIRNAKGGKASEFFAEVMMADGLIAKVN